MPGEPCQSAVSIKLHGTLLERYLRWCVPLSNQTKLICIWDSTWNFCCFSISAHCISSERVYGQHRTKRHYKALFSAISPEHFLFHLVAPELDHNQVVKCPLNSRFFFLSWEGSSAFFNKLCPLNPQKSKSNVCIWVFHRLSSYRFMINFLNQSAWPPN